jgi:hypothetical protein
MPGVNGELAPDEPVTEPAPMHRCDTRGRRELESFSEASRELFKECTFARISPPLVA